MNLFVVMCLAKHAKRPVDCCQLRRLGVDEVHGQEVDAMLVDVWYCFLNLCSLLSELKLE